MVAGAARGAGRAAKLILLNLSMQAVAQSLGAGGPEWRDEAEIIQLPLEIRQLQKFNLL